MATYLSFEWQGVLYSWVVMPFGWGPACRVFTELVQCMHKQSRAACLCITAYIDDRCGAHAHRPRQKLEARMQCALMGGLGWFINLLKSVLPPAQLARFLGYWIDSKAGRFTIPTEKVAYTLVLLHNALKAPAVTARTMSQIACRLIAARRAIPLAPLFCRALSGARAGAIGWDTLFDTPQAATTMLQFWVDNIHRLNGARFWQRKGGVTFAGDASAIGYGGHDVTGYLPANMRGDFTAAQREAVQHHTFSSTARELWCVRAALHSLVATIPEKVKHGKVRYITDNQATVLAGPCLSRGGPVKLPVLRRRGTTGPNGQLVGEDEVRHTVLPRLGVQSMVVIAVYSVAVPSVGDAAGNCEP
jgi:hypothetical protein